MAERDGAHDARGATGDATVAGATGAGKTLVIAEKRSVGRTIAAFLGCRHDHGAWVEGDAWDVTWAQGHLLRLLMPDEYDDHPAWRERGAHALPLVPDADGWRWQVSEERGAADQYAAVAALLGAGRYARVVNACDPDREGQAIADLALERMGCELPVLRLWCSSLEDAALRKAFGRLAPDDDYRGLFQSAVARSKADWLVGMNASRLYSSAMHAAQSVGRVRTPTLALVVQRDRAIEAFRGQDAHRVLLDLGGGFVMAGEPTADAAQARRVAQDASGAVCAVQAVERKRCREGAPTLLNTTGAQKLASERLGMAPDAVDRALQALYEKRLATYPRTDSRYVSAEDAPTLEPLVALVADEPHVGAAVARAFGAMPHDVQKVVDDAKVEGHGALLPTRQLTAARLAQLPPEEAAVARLLCASLLAAVAPDRVYDHVEVRGACRGLPYAASANADVERGWRRLRVAADDGTAGARRASGDSAGAPGGEPRSRVPADLSAPSDWQVRGASVRTTKAKPPRHFTDATLLAAMEHADRFVEGDELKTAIRDASLHSGGIGTPATRAGIITSLVDRGYLRRKGSTLTSTPDGRALVDEVAPDLRSVELTARMERDLSAIARGEGDPDAFVEGVVALVRGFVAERLARPWRTAAPRGEAIGTCPVCGAHVVDAGGERTPYLCENVRRERVDAPDGSATWRDCGSCGFRLYRTFMGASISPAAAKRLLRGQSVRLRAIPMRDGTTADRLVELDAAHGWRPRIARDQSVRVGTCPACGGDVLDTGYEAAPYLCEHVPGARPRAAAAASPEPAASCDFRLYRTYLGKRIAKADVARLLKGETVTLKGLTSRRTGATFNAFVALDAARGWRPRIVGYPDEQPAKAGAARGRSTATRAPEAGTSSGSRQESIPGLDC